MNKIIFSTLLFISISCGKLIPNKVKDAINMQEGQTMYVSGLVTHKVNFVVCYYTIADSKYSDDVVYVKCGNTKVQLGQQVTIKITPDDLFELDGFKMRRYIEVE